MATSNKAEEKPAQAADDKKPTYFVDGNKVSEKEYLTAAEKAGYERSYLELYPERRPVSISTKKHGE